MINKNKSKLNRRGSALLITIMVMGLLLLITLGLSKLIIGDLRSTADTIAAGKAYYAAEAGVETALLELHQNLPGYENEKGEIELNKEQEVSATYSIANQTQVYPWRNPEAYKTKNIQPKEFYANLSLNESVTIPLFIVDENGKTQDVEDFRVEYYIGYKSGKQKGEGLGSKITQDDVDVLRWKIFGLSKKAGDKRTEAISDYFPVTRISNATNPMCLGTAQAIQSTTPIAGNLANTKCSSTHLASASMAREYYKNEGGKTIYYAKDPIGFEAFANNFNQSETTEENPNNPEEIKKQESEDLPKGAGYPIKTFMQEHQNKYLTLTNIINPEIIDAPSDSVRKAIANIHYRIVIFPSEKSNPKTVREFATIQANGFYQDVKQSIETKIKMDQFLPVFNFSLYRTETEKNIQ